METLSAHRPAPNIKLTNLTLVKLLEVVLTLNNLHFNGVNFLQTGGTVMGTKVAPRYAVNFMGSFERRHIYTHSLKPLLYLIYIDDIFMIWQHWPREHEAFITPMNSCPEHIKFTTE